MLKWVNNRFELIVMALDGFVLINRANILTFCANRLGRNLVEGGGGFPYSRK